MSFVDVQRSLLVACAGTWLVASAATAVGCGSRKAEKETETPGDSKADKHYDVAVGSFHNGMFEDAKLQLDRALTTNPEHPDSHYLKGVLLLNEGKTIVDALEFEQCLTDGAAEQQRDKAERLHREAGAAFELAAGHYTEGAAGRGRALNSMSVVSLFFHDAEQAATQAKRALAEQFYTDRYSALSNLGWAYYQMGDLVSATAQLRQAVMINPDFCVGHYRLSVVYLESGLVERSLEHAKAVMNNERCPIQDAYRVAGVSHFRLGNEGDAQGALRSCMELSPRSCLARDCGQLLGPETAGETAVAQGIAPRRDP